MESSLGQEATIVSCNCVVTPPPRTALHFRSGSRHIQNTSRQRVSDIACFHPMFVDFEKAQGNDGLVAKTFRSNSECGDHGDHIHF
jgi:hypothetical protein